MIAESRPEMHVTQVEGVRAVWASVPGPLRAGLVVRVGSADETLPTAGISHVLEHLALYGIGRPGDHSNGFVDHVVTVYHCTGDEDLVRDFVRDVTRQLADPPTHRLTDERGVLRAETAGRRQSVEDTLLTWRYGAGTFGIASQEQLGLDRVDEDAVRAWAGRYATRGNSVLWFTGPPPAGLRVALPDGGPVAPPEPRTSILPELPAWFHGGDALGVGLHAVLERSWAGSFLQHVLGGRLVDELRVRQAAAYSPQTDYRPISRGTARLLAVSDLVDGRQTDTVRLFLAALVDLGGAEPPTEEELAAVRRLRDSHEAEPTSPIALVTSSAWNLAVGDPVETYDSLEAGATAVTPDDVAAAARQALASALAVVPPGVRMTREPWVQAPSSIHPVLEGPTYSGVPGGSSGELVVGRGGVTYRSGTHHVTVPVTGAVAVQRWADGLRVLVADDATRIAIEPTLWASGRRIVSDVDDLYPAELVVDMGERSVDEIPRPLPPEPGTAPARVPLLQRLPWDTVGMAVLAVALVGAAVAAAVVGWGAAVLPALVVGGIAFRSVRGR